MKLKSANINSFETPVNLNIPNAANPILATPNKVITLPLNPKLNTLSPTTSNIGEVKIKFNKLNLIQLCWVF